MPKAAAICTETLMIPDATPASAAGTSASARVMRLMKDSPPPIPARAKAMAWVGK